MTTDQTTDHPQTAPQRHQDDLPGVLMFTHALSTHLHTFRIGALIQAIDACNAARNTRANLPLYGVTSEEAAAAYHFTHQQGGWSFITEPVSTPAGETLTLRVQTPDGRDLHVSPGRLTWPTPGLALVRGLSETLGIDWPGGIGARLAAALHDLSDAERLMRGEVQDEDDRKQVKETLLYAVKQGWDLTRPGCWQDPRTGRVLLRRGQQLDLFWPGGSRDWDLDSREAHQTVSGLLEDLTGESARRNLSSSGRDARIAQMLDGYGYREGGHLGEILTRRLLLEHIGKTDQETGETVSRYASAYSHAPLPVRLPPPPRGHAFDGHALKVGVERKDTRSVRDEARDDALRDLTATLDALHLDHADLDTLDLALSEDLLRTSKARAEAVNTETLALASTRRTRWEASGETTLAVRSPDVLARIVAQTFHAHASHAFVGSERHDCAFTHNGQPLTERGEQETARLTYTAQPGQPPRVQLILTGEHQRWSTEALRAEEWTAALFSRASASPWTPAEGENPALRWGRWKAGTWRSSDPFLSALDSQDRPWDGPKKDSFWNERARRWDPQRPAAFEQTPATWIRDTGTWGEHRRSLLELLAGPDPLPDALTSEWRTELRRACLRRLTWHPDLNSAEADLLLRAADRLASPGDAVPVRPEILMPITVPAERARTVRSWPDARAQVYRSRREQQAREAHWARTFRTHRPQGTAGAAVQRLDTCVDLLRLPAADRDLREDTQVKPLLLNLEAPRLLAGKLIAAQALKVGETLDFSESDLNAFTAWATGKGHGSGTAAVTVPVTRTPDTEADRGYAARNTRSAQWVSLNAAHLTRTEDGLSLTLEQGDAHRLPPMDGQGEHVTVTRWTTPAWPFSTWMHALRGIQH